MNTETNNPTPEVAQPKTLEELKARERELWAACEATREADKQAARAWCDAKDALVKAERAIEFEAEVQKRLAAAKGEATP